MYSAIFDISDNKFLNIMRDPRLALPIRWNGGDFGHTLNDLFCYYISKVTAEMRKGPRGKTGSALVCLHIVTQTITKAVEEYQNGFPAKAYDTFQDLMEKLAQKPLRVYEKSGWESNWNDSLHLYRAARVDDNKNYSRLRVFHTPFNMRSKVSTCRYSIAGHPSLYLGTSLELCCNEINANPARDLILASDFQLDRDPSTSHLSIRVVELGIKPQDFIEPDDYDDNQADVFDNNLQNSNKDRRKLVRVISSGLTSKKTRERYLLWYPLIAACSFIRVNKKDPFAAEYIIPQLLMQWVRNEMADKGDELIGIRYFSCASIKDSDKGFNYVFPTSGEPVSPDIPYCKVLANAFMLTEPVYVHEYMSVQKCEAALRRMRDRQKIN